MKKVCLLIIDPQFDFCDPTGKLFVPGADLDMVRLGKFIEKKGEGIHHIAFAVNGLETALDEVRAAGIKLIDEQPRMGAEGLHIAFLHPKSSFGVLTELCEDKNK